MIDVPCDLCGENSASNYLRRIDRFSGEAFTYVTCSNCGLIYLSPRPEQVDLPRYYPAGYESHHDSLQESGEPDWHTRNLLSVKLDFLERFVKPPGGLFDVGCGTGLFLQAARARGWQVSGLEFIEAAARLAQQNFHLDVIVGGIEDARFPEKRYAVITMWDVLEHVASPRKTLERCWQLLEPDGVIIFSIPNLDSYDKFLFARNWVGWDAPRHFTLFSEATLNRLVEESGYKIIQKSCITSAKGTFRLSLESVIQNKWYRTSVLALEPLLSAVLFPYRQLAYKLNKAPILTVVIQKNVDHRA